ncbi:hypothetical protein [Sinorhizobium fredii]|uniref:hypothetical protein n=1 Tax=Rhizobium fredii TaxID=380 RepID=UPI003516DB55
MLIDPAQKMVGWHVLIETEIVKELRRSRLRSHHPPDPLKSLRGLNHASQVPAMTSFSTVSARSGFLSTFLLCVSKVV